MKTRYFLLSLLFIGLSTSSFAQTCTPDPAYTAPGIYPEELPNAEEGQHYEAVIHTVIPADTNVVFNGTTINVKLNYSEILEVKGLPSGFTYACSEPNCKFAGNSTGCMIISGDPHGGKQGTYPLEIRVKTNGTITGTTTQIDQVDTIQKFSIVINDTYVAVKTVDELSLTELVIYPNPTEGASGSILFVSANKAETASVRIYNLSGQLVAEQTSDLINGINRIPIPALTSPGLYHCVFDAPGRRITQKIVSE